MTRGQGGSLSGSLMFSPSLIKRQIQKGGLAVLVYSLALFSKEAGTTGETKWALGGGSHPPGSFHIGRGGKNVVG